MPARRYFQFSARRPISVVISEQNLFHSCLKQTKLVNNVKHSEAESREENGGTLEDSRRM